MRDAGPRFNRGGFALAGARACVCVYIFMRPIDFVYIRRYARVDFRRQREIRRVVGLIGLGLIHVLALCFRGYRLIVFKALLSCQHYET